MVFKIVNNWSHQQMATHYRETIANILQNFDNNQNSSRQFYNDLAWGGLTDYDSDNDGIYEEAPWFKNAFPDQSDRNRVKKTIKTEQGLGKKKNQKGGDGGC